MSTRKDLADALAEQLGDRFRCLPFDKNLDPISADLDAVLLIDAATYAPAPQSGRLVMTFPIHVVVGYTDPERAADQFDAVLEHVFAALLAIGNLTWQDAKPSMFDEQKPSYVITATLNSKEL